MGLFDATVRSPVKQWTDMAFRVNEGSETQRRRQLQEWALNSPEIRTIVEGDLLLYEHALSLFRSQTAEALGTVWQDP